LDYALLCDNKTMHGTEFFHPLSNSRPGCIATVGRHCWRREKAKATVIDQDEGVADCVNKRRITGIFYNDRHIPKRRKTR